MAAINEYPVQRRQTQLQGPAGGFDAPQPVEILKGENMENAIEHKTIGRSWYLVVIISILFLISSIEGSMIVRERTASAHQNTQFKQAIITRCLNTDEGAFYLVPVLSYDQAQQLRKDNEFYARKKGSKG